MRDIEKRQAWRKRHRAENLELYRQREAEYAAKNAERKKVVRAVWRAANKEREAEKSKQWKIANPERALELKRASYHRHKDEISEQRREKYATDPAYAAAHKALKKKLYQSDPAAARAKQKVRRDSHPEKIKLWREANRQRKRAKYMLHSVRRSAKGKRGKPVVDCDITEAWLQKRLDAGVCELSGLQFDLLAKRGPNSPSVDRIIPGGPYTQVNCRMVLWSVNRALNNYGEDYVFGVFRAILSKRDAEQVRGEIGP